ncbi:MAG: helix-turn-helix domain-containing protein [Firmicutes bacterium]|nr:helix-turn-helix domain-containing protein [Bacillota bacterium]
MDKIESRAEPVPIVAEGAQTAGQGVPQQDSPKTQSEQAVERSFGEFLAHRRKDLGLTQEQLGQKLFVGESAVSKWENNKTKPSIDVLKDLATVLQVSIDELVSASIDKQRVVDKQDAKKYRRIKSAYNIFILGSFGLALLVCLIVNLAVAHTLSWFFVVLCALLVASSLLIAPQFYRCKKRLFVPLGFLGSLLLLLGVTALYNGGDRRWFFVASCSLLLAYMIVFAPFWLGCKQCPSVLKKNKAIFCVLADILMLLLLLGVVYAVDGEHATNWLVTIALPIVGLAAIPIGLTVWVVVYTKWNKCIKAGLLILLWLTVASVNDWVNQRLGAESKNAVFWRADLTKWQGDIIANNVLLFVTLAAGLAALVCLVVGIVQIRQKRKSASVQTK